MRIARLPLQDVATRDGGWASMNKFEQGLSDDHQMPLAGDEDVSCLGAGGLELGGRGGSRALYSEVQSIMDRHL